MKHFAMIALAAFGALLAAAPGALAQNCTKTAPNCNCPPSITGITGIAYGNVTVPNGQSCSLINVTVTGNVTVGIGASLDVEDSIIVGNLQANNCNSVAFNGNAVDGSIQIGNCTGDPAFQNFSPITIGGDFQCHNNIGCVLHDSNVSGNVQVNNNNVNPHGKGSIIEDNIIGKDLQCQNNSPPPQVGNNTVVGNPDQSSEGQCLERQRQL